MSHLPLVKTREHDGKSNGAPIFYYAVHSQIVRSIELVLSLLFGPKDGNIVQKARTYAGY